MGFPNNDVMGIPLKSQSSTYFQVVIAEKNMI